MGATQRLYLSLPPQTSIGQPCPSHSPALDPSRPSPVLSSLPSPFSGSCTQVTGALPRPWEPSLSVTWSHAGRSAAEEKRAHMHVTSCVLCWRADVTGLEADQVEGALFRLPGFRETHHLTECGLNVKQGVSSRSHMLDVRYRSGTASPCCYLTPQGRPEPLCFCLSLFLPCPLQAGTSSCWGQLRYSTAQ